MTRHSRHHTRASHRSIAAVIALTALTPANRVFAQSSPPASSTFPESATLTIPAATQALPAPLPLADPVTAATPLPPPPPVTAPLHPGVFTISETFGGGSILDRGQGYVSDSLIITAPLFRDMLSGEVIGSAGFAPGASVDNSDLWLRLAIGLRFEPFRTAIRPYISLRATHMHSAAVGIWKNYPLDTLAGDSSHGLGHRSGLAGALGASWFVPHTREHLRVTANLEINWIAVGTAPFYYLTGEVGIGYSFR